MANINLYPPVLENTLPAFLVTNNDDSYCRVYFSLSKLSTYEGSIKSIHASVINQRTGQSVVKKVDNPSKQRYRKTGIIIINKAPIAVSNSNNLYYVDILNDDINGRWNPGTIYKIQLRLSTVLYIENNQVTQSTWLKNNANNFSEWTSYCITKATSKPTIRIPILQGFDSSDESSKNNITKLYNFFSSTTLEINGTYRNEEDPSEILYSYQFQLYETSDNDEQELGDLYEDSGIIYAEQYSDQEQNFYYFIKRDLESLANSDNKKSKTYILKFSYSTINGLIGNYSFKLNIIEPKGIQFEVFPYVIDNAKETGNSDFIEYIKKQTSISEEEEEGRIGIKLYTKGSDSISTNFCIRRADSRDNYKVWSDIKILVCFNKPINTLDMVFDNTIESGVWYKYGVQVINEDGERGKFYINQTPVMREFNYSYLIGEGGRQLKLQYNNTMNSYTYNYSDSKTDTIGGKYPYITRNGNMKYRSFPINGLITFNMDKNNLFTSDKELYGYDEEVSGEEIAGNYIKWRKANNIDQYDYKREFDFREKVLDFLQDGKPKLFKSATEGNIIVRLMNVTAQPEQSLNRMIYSFTSNAYEIADNTMDNYQKYNFYSVGDYQSSFSYSNTYLGQLDVDFYPNVENKNNIISKIWEKYDTSNYNAFGYISTLKRIHHLKINFESIPFKIQNSGGELLTGYNLLYNDELITINSKYGNVYQFDDSIIFDRNTNLLIQGSCEDYEGKEKEVIHLNIDFLYDTESSYVEAGEDEIDTQENGIGQIFGIYKPSTDLFKEIKLRLAYDNGIRFRRLNSLEWICIEAIPGSVFSITDESDDQSQYHEINDTGILNLEGVGYIASLRYEGVRDFSTGKIKTDKSALNNLIIDYMYLVEEGNHS